MPDYYRSDTLSRLKGIETLLSFLLCAFFLLRSDTLSRLKGIETLTKRSLSLVARIKVQIRFPV